MVYTAVFGDNALLMPQRFFAGVDFICFTEKPRKVKGWQFRIVPPPCGPDNVRNNRYYKLQPHLHVPGYDHSIYIDGNFIVTDLPADRFSSLLEKADMLVFDHGQTATDARSCVYQEYDALMKRAKEGTAPDDPQVMEAQIAYIKSEGYPADNGLLSGAVLIRKHNQPLVKKAMDMWWDMVKHRSRRDQLSFNFVAWKTGLVFAYLEGDIRRGNKWFYHAGKGDKHLWYIFLKYRIRKWLKRVTFFN
ncbi:MAG TPA: DUF616 domain-containing protein [Chitinophagaceae bacterium]|nr:DUF616 domain-containing protein [Chitinophagaceae bacterium]